MKHGILQRLPESDEQGTFGDLAVDGAAFRCKTAELPWRNNEKGRSCIPPGTYVFKIRTDSPKHGTVYEMVPDAEAPDRVNVQIHAANFPDQLLGCIAPGQQIAMIEPKPGEPPKKGVTASKNTLQGFMAYMGGEDLELIIKAAVL